MEGWGEGRRRRGRGDKEGWGRRKGRRGVKGGREGSSERRKGR